jgi:hypothetical protein
MLRSTIFSLLFPAILVLTGCDQVNQQLGLEDPAKKEARQEAEGKAIGSACRHSGRAIEDCYAIYTWVPKAAVFAGWQEMDAYMRDNNIETVAPQLPPPENPANARKKKKASAENSEAAEPASGKVDESTVKKAEEPATKKTEEPAAKH